MNNTDNLDKLDTVHEAGIDEAAVSDGAVVQGFGFSDTEIKGAIEALLLRLLMLFRLILVKLKKLLFHCKMNFFMQIEVYS